MKGYNMLDIEGYEGHYAVTTCGKVWSYKTNKFLRQLYRVNSNCYVISLSKNCVPEVFAIQKVVARAFLENPHNYEFIAHLDYDRSNNAASNLKWVETRHINKARLLAGIRGAVHRKFVKVYKYKRDGTYIEGYESVLGAAREHNMEPSAIVNTAKGRCRTAGGFIWRYTKEKITSLTIEHIKKDKL